MPDQPLPASLPAVPGGAESRRLQRTHIRGRTGVSVREADRRLGLNGGGRGLLDTTHFDTVPP